jgi:uncharacterized protein
MSKDYQVTCDLFTVPYNQEEKLLYAPRIGFLCLANKDLLDMLASIDTIDSKNINDTQKEVLDYLSEKGVINGEEEKSLHKKYPEKFSPVQVTLFPTTQCNLRCRYCYASAGETKAITMDWRYAVSALDAVIRNAKELGQQQISLGFHGGGEPLFPWRFIQRVVRYAEEESKKNELGLTVYAATNGLLSEKQLAWIVQHFSNLNISFDGLPRVQDYHRPLPGGQGSFKHLDNTFKFLDKHKFNYGIRSTISEYNIDLMEESIDFIAENYHPVTVHFEPVFQCGRCKTDDEYQVSLSKFADHYEKCEEKSRKHGFRFTYSGCRVESLSNTFCGIACDSFSVTPDGYITSCFETTTLDDDKSGAFFIGKINDHGELEVDEKKRSFLHSLTVENLDYCKDCYAKWHCAGDCVAKLGHNDFQGERGHERCELNRKLVANKLIKLIDKEY